MFVALPVVAVERVPDAPEPITSTIVPVSAASSAVPVAVDVANIAA
tara:strand:- start:12 stop:149 length:138 start_codon:yes stop_codon:yes gene_type:complete